MPWTATESRLLGQRVHELRIQRKLTQERLAQYAHCSKNHIQVIEKAGRSEDLVVNLQMETLYGLADALEVDPWDLVR